MDLKTQTQFSSEMFVIRQTDPDGSLRYRKTEYVDGRAQRDVTSDVRQADMFKSKDTALDHAIFTLSEIVPVSSELSVIPVTISQMTETEYTISGEIIQVTR